MLLVAGIYPDYHLELHRDAASRPRVMSRERDRHPEASYREDGARDAPVGAALNSKAILQPGSRAEVSAGDTRDAAEVRMGMATCCVWRLVCSHVHPQKRSGEFHVPSPDTVYAVKGAASPAASIPSVGSLASSMTSHEHSRMVRAATMSQMTVGEKATTASTAVADERQEQETRLAQLPLVESKSIAGAEGSTSLPAPATSPCAGAVSQAKPPAQVPKRVMVFGSKGTVVSTSSQRHRCSVVAERNDLSGQGRASL